MPWDGRELLTFKGHNVAILSVAFSPNGKRIVTGSSSLDPTVKVWEAASVAQVAAWRQEEQSGRRVCGGAAALAGGAAVQRPRVRCC